MQCIMCNKEIGTRKGKVVCSTTCRVNKHKAMKVCDRLLEHFLKDDVFFRQLYSIDNVANRTEYKKNVVEDIARREGKIGEAWATNYRKREAARIKKNLSDRVQAIRKKREAKMRK